MRTEEQQQALDHYIEHFLGVPLSSLMEPVGDDQVGENVRHNGVYFNIKEARQQDDPTLPRGVWSHELKTADWNKVRQVAIDALKGKSKDLQLGVWLFEANIHSFGFAGVAPSAILIQELCEHFWDNMHPQIQDGDLEYRTNPITWINDKLTLHLRLIPLTHVVLDGDEYSWDDLENAQRHEQLKNQGKLPNNWEGLTPKAFKQRLTATASDHVKQQVIEIRQGLEALDNLQAWFDDRCGNESPGLHDMTQLLHKVDDLLTDELQKRGIRLSAAGEDEADSQSDSDEVIDDGGAGGSGDGSDGGTPSPFKLKNRAEAFICLRKAAEFLMQDDPHSPVPYLVNTAIEWGERSAPELYQQLFLTQGGQLNIFEIMGLDISNENR